MTSHPVVLEYPDIQLFAQVQSESQGPGSEQVPTHQGTAHTQLDLVTLTPGADAGTSV